MRFSDYLSETFWAALDKALPLVYGFGYVVLVVPALPENEFGLLGIVEVIFYFILAIDNGLVQTPMAKFAAESEAGAWAIPNGFILSAAILSVSGFLIVSGSSILAAFFNDPQLQEISWYVPALLAAFYLKNLSSQICIARQWTGRLFAVDAVYFLGSLMLLMALRMTNTLASALHVVLSNVGMAAAASLVGAAFTWQIVRQSRWRFKPQETLRFLDFGRYSLGAGLGAYLNAQLDTIFVGYCCGPVQVAIYRSGKIIYRFFNAFSQAVQVIVFPLASKLAAAQRRAELRALFEKTVFFSYLVLIPLNVALWLGAEWIFAQLYGGKYAGGVAVFRWLLLGAFALPFGAIGINLLLGIGKPHLTFRITWATAAIYAICSAAFIAKLGIVGAAMATVAAIIAGAALTAFFVRKHVGFTGRGILQRYADVVNFVKAI